MNHKEVINFWFNEIEPLAWWKKSVEFDKKIERRFSALHSAAVAGELYQWRIYPEGRLAEIIILDQFSRNIFRDQARSFASDAQALVLAQEAVALGVLDRLRDNQKAFLLMPYMHSESLLVHQQAVKLFSELGNKDNLDFEKKHMAIIERFGRYPHRNAILNRESTKEEMAFLKTPGSSF